MGTTLWKKDLRWTGLTGVLAHLYVGTENDTGSYKIFLRSWHQHSGGEPNKKFKQCRSGTMDIGISVLPGPIMIINVGSSSVTCVSAVCGDFCVPRMVVFSPFPRVILFDQAQSVDQIGCSVRALD